MSNQVSAILLFPSFFATSYRVLLENQVMNIVGTTSNVS